jgi:LysR family transcriptional regulator, chromosome initiation inhibitor
MSLLGPNLDAFLAIVKHSTVTEAAKRLRIGQTGVTQRIRNLEEELGTTLFLRSRRGMKLTEAGLALLQYCELSKGNEGELLAKLHNSGKVSSQRVSITGPSSILRSRVVRAVSEVHKIFPSLFFHLDLSDTVSGSEKLRTGAAHLAIIKREEVSNEMQSRLLSSQRYVLVAAAKFEGKRLSEILATQPIVDFDPSDEMTFAYLREFDLLKQWRGERHFANNTDALTALVAEGLGISVLARDFVETSQMRKKLTILNGGKALDYPVALAWYPRPQMPEWLEVTINSISKA